MSFIKKIAIGIATAAAIAGGLIYLNRPDHKYRLTINVETPSGIKTGSGVIAVYHAKDGGILPGVGGGTGIKGDAIFIDLGNGRNLVALLARGEHASYVDGMDDLAWRAFQAAGRPELQFSDVKKLTGTVPLIGALIPTLATLKDVSDPESIVEVRANDLAAVFGAGYQIQNVLLTMLPVGLWPFDFGSFLGEPVTRGIDKKIPFLLTHREQLRRIYDDLPPRLHPQPYFFSR